MGTAIGAAAFLTTADPTHGYFRVHYGRVIFGRQGRFQIQAGADVSCSVLLPGARVEAGAVVERSVLGEGAEVAPGARVTAYSVIGDGAVVERDARLDGARVAGAIE